MKKRILGRTGLEVGELSLGSAFITGGKDGFDGALPVVKKALDYGMNLADTSADYGDSEEGLGYALNKIDRACIVSTKLGPMPGQTDFDPKSKDCIMRIVEHSLKMLKRDSIDILMVHEPDRPGQFDWYNDGVSFEGPVADVLRELKDQGIIKYTGLGGTTAYALARIMATGFYDVVLTAFQSSPLWREFEHDVLPEAQKQNMGVMLASPTQQGWLIRDISDKELDDVFLLSSPRRKQLKAFFALCRDVKIAPPVMCLRWALAIKGVSTVLTGPRNVEQLEQNMQAVQQGVLPDDVSGRLDEIAAMVPFRPADEPAGCILHDQNPWGPAHLS